jgi:Raf kinase inhibitor-like YbhB/YbcL family protein
VRVFPSRKLRTVSALAAAGLAAGCGGGVSEPAARAPTELQVSSPAFAADAEVPARFTCRGAGASPPLVWSGPVRDAAALALVVDDPDAPRGTYVHWVVLDIPVTTARVAEGPRGAVPAGAREAKNSAGRTGWTPPCPPSGRHRYRFTVYTLDAPTRLSDGVALDKALDAIDKHASTRGRLTGTVSAASGAGR